MKLLLLLIGKQLDGILLTGNTLCRLLFSSGLTIGQKALRKSLSLESSEGALLRLVQDLGF